MKASMKSNSDQVYILLKQQGQLAAISKFDYTHNNFTENLPAALMFQCAACSCWVTPSPVSATAATSYCNRRADNNEVISITSLEAT